VQKQAKPILIIFILIAIFVFIPKNAFTAETNSFDPLELEAYLDGIIKTQMDDQHIAGAIVSVVQNGEILLLKGYGYADLEKRIAADPRQSLFRIGSTSKIFTWTAVMQLVEEGKLDLDTDINSYLDFEIPAALYHSSEDFRPDPITLTHLMTHTPGFEDIGEGLFVLKPEKIVSLESYIKDNIPARIYKPGTVMAYSNYGAALAGYIVEIVSGMPFAAYVEQNIYKPLDMTNSTFRQPLPEQLAARMAEGYKYSNGQYYSGSFEYISALPAGSMSSTAEDMAKFMIAHLTEGQYRENRILQEKTVRQMHSRLHTQHPAQLGMAHGFIEESFNGYRVIGHGGNTVLFNTGFYLIPDLDLGIFVSYNGGIGTERANLLQLFMDRYYPETKTLEPVPIENNLELRETLVGEYLPTRSNFTTMEKLLGLFQSANVGISDDGYLLINLYGQIMQFAETKPGIFHNRDTSGTRLSKVIVFTEDSSGQIFMYPEGPMPYYKAPWYGTSTTFGLVFSGTLLMLISAMAGWLIASVIRLFRRKIFRAPSGSLLARLVAALCGLIAATFFAGLLSILGDVNPAFGVPNIFFGESENIESLLKLPLIFAIFTGLMTLFSLLAWIKKYWTVWGRMHYTLITISSLGLVWLMNYYNLL
jgi:CubicO group peptidase (beta-lactamase class C family)